VRTRYQYGNVELSPRRRGPDIWLYRYWEPLANKRVRKGTVIGTIEQYPTKAAAEKAAERFRTKVNNGDQSTIVNFGQLIDRYIAEEIPQRYSTRHSYLSFLENHIRPRWGNCTIAEVNKPYVVRQWLRGLPLASKTKGHLRNLMRRLFDCAMLWELLELNRNPMSLVRIEGATKRQHEPRVLTIEEFHKLLEHVQEEPFRTMLLVAMCLGLRCSELLGLKWSDFDWDNLTAFVQRGVVAGRVDDVKTKYSRMRVPLDPALGEALLNWKRKSEFKGADDWVFASPFQAGEMPYRPWGVQQRRISPAARAAGLGDNIGWHTFRHTYRSLLDETGAPMKVQQELMRHASISTTMNIYGAAMTNSKREANSKVVRMVLSA